jgi:tRNA modification GTPase
MTSASDSTVVVELTPTGRGAVAVVLVAGPRALTAVRQIFVPNTAWCESGPTVGRISLGRWGSEQGEELVVCRRETSQFEIHCHGGPAAVDGVINRLVSAGCRREGWREWLASQATTDSIEARDPSMVAASIALSEATTARTAGILLEQLNGAMARTVEDVRAAISRNELDRAAELVDSVLRFREVGLHLTTPWRVVIAGPPNVGKSSLLNAIAGYQRAIVSPMPGTTRDVVTINTAIDGWPVHIVDTAGLRETQDELESAGVALAGAAIDSADLILAVSDASQSMIAADFISWELLPTQRVLSVANKCDLVPSPPPTPNTYYVSALTGQGIATLIAAIGRTLVPTAPPANAAIAFTPEQVAGLEVARAAIHEADRAAAEAALATLSG